MKQRYSSMINDSDSSIIKLNRLRHLMVTITIVVVVCLAVAGYIVDKIEYNNIQEDSIKLKNTVFERIEKTEKSQQMYKDMERLAIKEADKQLKSNKSMKVYTGIDIKDNLEFSEEVPDSIRKQTLKQEKPHIEVYERLYKQNGLTVRFIGSNGELITVSVFKDGKDLKVMRPSSYTQRKNSTERKENGLSEEQYLETIGGILDGSSGDISKQSDMHTILSDSTREMLGIIKADNGISPRFYMNVIYSDVASTELGGRVDRSHFRLEHRVKGELEYIDLVFKIGVDNRIYDIDVI